jgi:nucleoside-diphosphate-sugar epimerase
MSELHVIYGTGPVGRAVMDELLRQEKAVRVVSFGGRTQVPDDVEGVQGDARDADHARKVCQGATHVYACVNAPDYHKWPEQFPPLQAGIMEGAAANSARLIVMENLYMYGPHDGKPMTEDMPLCATGSRGVTRKQMTLDLWAAHEAGLVRAVSGRASDFFGPHVKESAAGERLFRPAIEGGTVRVMGDPDQPHTYTYIPDIGKALVMLGANDDVFGRPWHIPSPRTVTTREFLTMICALTGQEPHIQGSPKWMLNLMGAFFVPAMRGIGENYYQFDEPFIVDHSQFKQRFGDIVTPLEQAVERTVAWYRDQRPSG